MHPIDETVLLDFLRLFQIEQPEPERYQPDPEDNIVDA